MLQNGLTSLHLTAQEDRVSVAEVLTKHDGNLDQQTKVQKHSNKMCHNVNSFRLYLIFFFFF